MINLVHLASHCQIMLFLICHFHSDLSLQNYEEDCPNLCRSLPNYLGRIHNHYLPQINVKLICVFDLKSPFFCVGLFLNLQRKCHLQILFLFLKSFKWTCERQYRLHLQEINIVMRTKLAWDTLKEQSWLSYNKRTSCVDFWSQHLFLIWRNCPSNIDSKDCMPLSLLGSHKPYLNYPRVQLVLLCCNCWISSRHHLTMRVPYFCVLVNNALQTCYFLLLTSFFWNFHCLRNYYGLLAF